MTKKEYTKNFSLNYIRITNARLANSLAKAQAEMEDNKSDYLDMYLRLAFLENKIESGELILLDKPIYES